MGAVLRLENSMMRNCVWIQVCSGFTEIQSCLTVQLRHGSACLHADAINAVGIGA